MSIFDLFSSRPNVIDLKSQGDVDGLIEALNYDKDHNLRISAAWALGEIGDASAVEPLVEALSDRKRVKDVAAKALGEIGDPQAIDPLVDVLQDENWEVRSTAAKALGNIGDIRAVEPLIDALEDQNEIVRWYATQALENITGESLGDDAAEWKALIARKKFTSSKKKK
jgi:HEAT repeat protein